MSSTPLSSLGGAPIPSGAAGPSDFTMMIRGAPAPVIPTIAPAPPVEPAEKGATKKRIPMGLIVVINAVVLIAIALVFLVVLRKPVPTVPKVPAAPAAPTAPALPKLK